MLQEWNEGSTDTNHLVGCDIHIINTLRVGKWIISIVTAGNTGIHKFTVFIQLSICLGDHIFIFSISRKVFIFF